MREVVKSGEVDLFPLRAIFERLGYGIDLTFGELLGHKIKEVDGLDFGRGRNVM
jgi:hypothetical protein